MCCNQRATSGYIIAKKFLKMKKTT
uniref:Uncharacterized protein n=1 Tax=Romanomermis culicivorax TaxID=13658 RepID=A0A915K175_ROMCU